MFNISTIREIKIKKLIEEVKNLSGNFRTSYLDTLEKIIEKAEKQIREVGRPIF